MIKAQVAGSTPTSTDGEKPTNTHIGCVPGMMAAAYPNAAEVPHV
jgi:hypothetical protein